MRTVSIAYLSVVVSCGGRDGGHIRSHAITRRMLAFLASGREPTGTESVAQARLSLFSWAFQLLACRVVFAMTLCRKKYAQYCHVDCFIIFPDL